MVFFLAYQFDLVVRCFLNYITWGFVFIFDVSSEVYKLDRYTSGRFSSLFFQKRLLFQRLDNKYF